MKIGLRIFLGYFLIVAITGFLLAQVFVAQVKPGVRQAMEDTLVDTANVLAELATDDFLAGRIDDGAFARRVRVVLRRMQPPQLASTRQHDPVFAHDAEGHRIRYRGRVLDLTRYEYGLLAALLQRPGAVLSRAQLMDRVWGDALESGDRTVDTHIKTLRAKLRDVAPDEDPIRTHRGLGYSLEVGA